MSSVLQVFLGDLPVIVLSTCPAKSGGKIGWGSVRLAPHRIRSDWDGSIIP
ncbi:MAG: hypothetical protein QXG11_04800 [Candidatus Bathyarchaeia archaeon]